MYVFVSIYTFRHIIKDIYNRDVFIPQTMGNTSYFHEDDVGAQLHLDQALLWGTPSSESPVTLDEIFVELFLVNAGIGFQPSSCLHYGQEYIKVCQ